MSLLRLYLTLAILLVSVSSREVPNAYIEIILYEPDQQTGRYLTKTKNVLGYFSTVGSTAPAEGNIKMMHPLGLCLDSDNDDFLQNYRYGWVGVIKLEPPHYGPESCRHVITKAKRAIEKGATAVIFDITNYPNALSQLNAVTPNLLDRPVIVIQDEQAVKLMTVLREEVETEEARARIERSVLQEVSSNHMFDMGLFIVCFTMVFILGLILVAKFKCLRKRRELSINNLTINALEQMKTRKYRKNRNKKSTKKLKTNTSDEICSKSVTSSTTDPMCAICLEEFSDGQELRAVPCGHEFHKKCIDKWLNEKWTCPLCNMDVLENLSIGYRDVRINDSRGIQDNLENHQRRMMDNSLLRNSRVEITQSLGSRNSNSQRPPTFPRQIIPSAELSVHRHLSRCGHRPHAVNNTYVDPRNSYQRTGHGSSLESNGSQANVSCKSSCNHRNSVLTDRTLSSCRGICGSNPSMFSVENISPTNESNIRKSNASNQSGSKSNCSNKDHICHRYKSSTSRSNKENSITQTEHCTNSNKHHCVEPHNNQCYVQNTAHKVQGFVTPGSQKILSLHQHNTANNHFSTSTMSNIAGDVCIANETRTKLTPCRHTKIKTNKHDQFSKYENILNPNNGLRQSGYSPDSSDNGESAFSISYVRRKKSDTSKSSKYRDPSLQNSTSTSMYENLPQDMLSDSSIQCIYGSSTLYKTKLQSLSTHENMPSNSQDGLQISSARKATYERWLASNIKITDRPNTPCIGYSSSDEAEDIARFSNSSLEGILGV